MCVVECCVDVARRAHNGGRRYRGRTGAVVREGWKAPNVSGRGTGTERGPLTRKLPFDMDQVAADQPPTTRCWPLLLLAASGHMRAIRRVCNWIVRLGRGRRWRGEATIYSKHKLQTIRALHARNLPRARSCTTNTSL